MGIFYFRVNFMSTKQTRSFNLLDSVSDKTSPFHISIVAFCKNMERMVAVRRIPLVATEDEYDKIDRGNDTETYPYAFLRMTMVEFTFNGQNNKAAARHGYPVINLLDPDLSVTNAAVPKQFLFPVRVSFEFTYKTNSFSDVLTLIQKMGLLHQSLGMSFKISAPMYSELTNVIKLDSPSISLSPALLNDEAEPSAHKLVYTLTLDTYSGVFKDVPKVNNEGKATVGVSVSAEDSVK